MKEQIEGLLKEALTQEFNQQQVNLPEVLSFVVERPKDKNHGDFSSNIAMLNAKFLKIAPRTLAELLVARMANHTLFEKLEIAGPGFINFTFKQNVLQNQIDAMWQSSRLGVEPVTEPQTIIVDYSSPNLAKEMHVGHLRSTIIGDAIANVLALKGYRVIRQNHVGDWGTQFGMLLAHFDDEQKTHADAIDLSDLETFYKAAKKRFDEEEDFAERSRNWVVLLQSGDEHCLNMWHKFIDLSLSHCHEIYQRLGVKLKLEDVRAESAYNDDLPVIIDLLKQKGLLETHDGAQCVFMPEFKGKNDEPLPVIVQKKDGGFLYASTDLAALRYRCQVLKADRILYVVDARQSLHFQQVFALAKLAGFVRPETLLEHIGFGMVLDKSGRPYKSREGGVTKLADLLNEAEHRAQLLIEAKQTQVDDPEHLKEMASVIGISSVKYADLSKNRISDYVFDWDTMISFEGNTAPYLLYAYTRINSIFSKAGIDDWQTLQAEVMLEQAQEIALAKHLISYAEVINQVALKASPHFLCGYLYELAVLFSSFYENCPILNQENAKLKQSRLKLAALTAKVLKQGLGLLGISTLSRM
jgi:arginyl-tRNA synthetase